MKVVHICTTLEGGAGLVTKRIALSTKAMGVDVRVLVASGKKSELVDVINPVYPWSKIWLIRKIQVLLNIRGVWPKADAIFKKISEEKRKNLAPVTFTSPITMYRNLITHPWVQEADLIHLHWIGDFIDYKSFFNEVRKPIIWSVHDENPGLGGFHYQMWKDHATESFKALDDELALIKEKAYGNVKSMTLVAMSTMMKDFFGNSKLLSRFPSVVIHNGIDENSFTQISRLCAREALNIPVNSVVFLFAAQNIHEDRKGLKELIEALDILKIPNAILVCMGSYYEVPTASFEIRCEGYVGNNRLQSLYYSAANYFVMPSYQEVFAQVPMEAMACGTPVVAFPCSGASDLIDEENGIVCDDFTVDSLIKGILSAMSNDYCREKIRENIIKRFSYDKIAQQYIELYKIVLSNSNALINTY